MNRQKLWTKNFLIISAANFIIYFTFYLLMVTMSLFVTEKFNASASQAGLASGIFVIGALFARIISGKYLEKIGYKKMLYFGLIFFLITTICYIFVQNMGMLILDRFLNGACMGIASTATGTIVAKIIPDERRGEGTGYYTLSLTLSAAVGPFLGMLISRNSDFQKSFLICAAVVTASLIAVFFVKVPENLNAGMAAPVQKAPHSFSFKSFFEVNAIPISVVSAITAFGYASILSFLTSYVKEIHLSYAGSFFFVVYAATVFLSRPFTGKLLDKKGESIVIYPAICTFAAALFLLGCAGNSFLLLLAGVLVGLGYGTLSSSCIAIAIKSSPSEHAGLTTSTSYMFQDLGIGI